ncbi:unnamed protein product, partial [Polarella glacialis]
MLPHLGSSGLQARLDLRSGPWPQVLRPAKRRELRRGLVAKALGPSPEVRAGLEVVQGSCVGRAGLWRRALLLLLSASALGLRLNAAAWGAGVTACTRANQWAHALGLLGEISARGVRLDTLGTQTGMIAGRWEQGMHLLSGLAWQSMEPLARSCFSPLLMDCQQRGNLGGEIALMKLLGRMGSQG